MPARHALIDLARSLEECDVIGSDQAVTAVAHLGASADVDAHGGQRVRAAFRGPVQHRHVDTQWRRPVRRHLPLRLRHSIELDVEIPGSASLCVGGVS